MSKFLTVWSNLVVLLGFWLILRGGYSIMQLRKVARSSGGMVDHQHYPPAATGGGPVETAKQTAFPSSPAVDPLLDLSTPNSFDDSGVPVHVLVGVFVGAVTALVGAVLQLGGFRPIRLCETKKAEWDSNYERASFRSLHGRAKWAAHLTACMLPPPPPPPLLFPHT
eukprot:GHVS01037878.1.p1 GENE.GHVS01037878.1~~GHVS01037878.1.p1  ORF type:complete len:167 (+),score=43.68 GHVS01037878.1:265-765(+)